MTGDCCLSARQLMLSVGRPNCILNLRRLREPCLSIRAVHSAEFYKGVCEIGIAPEDNRNRASLPEHPQVG